MSSEIFLSLIDPKTATDFIPLPSDPRKLTRELALRCCTHPEVLAQAFALLALELAKRESVAQKDQNNA